MKVYVYSCTVLCTIKTSYSILSQSELNVSICYVFLMFPHVCVAVVGGRVCFLYFLLYTLLKANGPLRVDRKRSHVVISFAH